MQKMQQMQNKYTKWKIDMLTMTSKYIFNQKNQMPKHVKHAKCKNARNDTNVRIQKTTKIKTLTKSY